MGAWRNRLRLKWFIARNALGFTCDFVDRLYRIYLGHGKVIHFRDGHPVYSLTTPALYSKPAANFFARQVYKVIRGKNTPNLMSFAVTDHCAAGCEHCSFFSGMTPGIRSVLSLDQSRKLLRDAQELGVTVINFVGGEPLEREDLTAIIAAVDKDLSTTVLFTNGWLLADNVKALRTAGLDSVYVSIDWADSGRHDAFRGKAGLFEKALCGIREATAAGLSTGICCCMSPEYFAQGGFREMVELGRKVGVHEILFFGAIPTGRYRGREDLIGNTDWIEAMIVAAQEYSADPRYPGLLVYPYAASHRCVGCSGGVTYFYVSPYGDVCPCDFNHRIFGNILERPLYQIWDGMTSLDDFRCAKWGGCKLKDPQWRDRKTISREFSPFEP